MENGVNVVVDDNPGVEMEASGKAVDLPSSERIEKNVLAATHEYYEGYNAFVEAIGDDAEEDVHLNAEGTDDVFLDGQVTQAEKAPDLEPPKEDDGDSDSGHEADVFQEAIWVPAVVTTVEPDGKELPLSVVMQEEVKELVCLELPTSKDSNTESEVTREFNDEVSVSVVAAEPALKEAVVDEVASRTGFGVEKSNKAVDNGLISHVEGGKREITSNGGGAWEDGMKVGDKTFIEKSENGYSDDMNLKGGVVFDSSENSIAGEVSEVADSVSLDAKSDGDVMIQEGMSEELKHRIADPITECQDDSNGEHVRKGDRPPDVGGISAVTSTGGSGIGSSTSVSDPVILGDEALEAQTSDLGDQDLKSPQVLTASGNINGIYDERVETKRDSTGDEVKKETDEGKNEQEIQPIAETASLSAKPANPAPLPACPDGLGGAAPLLEPAPRAHLQPRVMPTISSVSAQLNDGPANGEAEETDETREKLQILRVKFLRLAYRLGQTPHNVVVAQVLYRLGLAEQLRGRNGGRTGAFSFDRASAMAEQLEAAGQEPLDFSCTIMVLGKTGVGKSATINSIFDDVMFGTNAFDMGTKKVQDVVGTVQGIKVRVIDTPGLLPFWSDQRKNAKILSSVKRFIKKSPPDIVLYLDRLDMQTREFGDAALLRTISEVFGPSIWFSAIVVFTHAATAPPDGPNGIASSYDMFVTQRSHLVQQAIRQAAGDMRLMSPVSLVENHSACRTNRAGQRVLPNGQIWKSHLLLLSFASKILAEANALLKLQDSPPDKSFAAQSRPTPLPFLLSSLIQSRPQLKLPGDEDALDESFDELSDSDDEVDYEELPPFKSLTKVQLQKLSKDQRKAYFDELGYREKLLFKMQMKEKKSLRKLMKEKADSAQVPVGDPSENAEAENDSTATVPGQMPDMALPFSFDSDNPTHRYRFLDSSNQWLVRPVLETHGWDHDVGYEGINVEKVFVVKDKIPLSFSGQVMKDKKDANVQIEVGSSVTHGQGKYSSIGFDMQTAGKDMIYTVRGETMLSNHKRNKATAGLSATLLGDTLSTGVKLEDKLIVNKRLQFVATGGAMTGHGDVAYGGSLEATLRDKDYPLGRSLSTLGLSIMDWHGDLVTGCNVQSQIPVGRSTNLIAKANLNNRGTGQVSIRLNSSEQWQIFLVGVIPLVRKLYYHLQELQYGQ